MPWDGAGGGGGMGGKPGLDERELQSRRVYERQTQGGLGAIPVLRWRSQQEIWEPELRCDEFRVLRHIQTGRRWEYGESGTLASELGGRPRIVVLQWTCVSASLRPHWLQHARLPCTSRSPRVWSNSSPWSWWYHPTSSSYVLLFRHLIL